MDYRQNTRERWKPPRSRVTITIISINLLFIFANTQIPYCIWWCKVTLFGSLRNSIWSFICTFREFDFLSIGQLTRGNLPRKKLVKKQRDGIISVFNKTEPTQAVRRIISPCLVSKFTEKSLAPLNKWNVSPSIPFGFTQNILISDFRGVSKICVNSIVTSFLICSSILVHLESISKFISLHSFSHTGGRQHTKETTSHFPFTNFTSHGIECKRRIWLEVVAQPITRQSCK